MRQRLRKHRSLDRQQHGILNPPLPKPEPVQRMLELQKDPDTGDTVMVLPPDLLQQLDWREGDRLCWKRVRRGVWELVNRTLRARQRRKLHGTPIEVHKTL